MKKLLLIFFLLTVVGYSLPARAWPDIRMAQPLIDAQWSPLQISVWPISLVPAVNVDDSADIYGLNLNLTTIFHCQKNVYGVSCGLFQAAEKHCGLTIALINVGASSNGLAVGFSNVFLKNSGVCIGVINDAVDRNTALTGGKIKRSSTPNWLQIGLFNLASEGVQFGLFNVAEPAEDAKSIIQIGLINHNPESNIPWMPLINWNI